MYRALRLLGLAALIGAGCATLGLHELRPLRFSEADRPATLRLLTPGEDHPAGAAAVRLWARVENGNSFGVVLSDLEGRLHLEGEPGPRATFPLGLPLEAGQDTVIPIDLTIAFDELPDLARAVRAAVVRRAVGYRLEGSFSVEAGRIGPARFGPQDLLTGELRVAR